MNLFALLRYSTIKRALHLLYAASRPLNERQVEFINHVTSVYDGLTLREMEQFFNGFGSELPGLSLFTKVIPKFYRDVFLAAANWHDCAYLIGGGKADQIAADAYFLKQMCNSALSLAVDKMFWGFVWAALSWIGVALVGSMSWQDRELPLTLEQVQKRARGKMYGE